MMVGLIQIDLVDLLLGFFIVPLPFYIMAYLNEGSIGGGDVKFISEISFVLQVRGSVPSLIIALPILICTEVFINRKERKYVPLLPYLLIGAFIAFQM